MAQVSIDRVGKDAVAPGNKVVRILGEVSLEVGEGEFLVLVGPSGCGKTTLLRCIAGLEEISRGTLSFDGKRMNDAAPKDRDVAMVFQSYALYPHLTVRQNLGFALEMQKLPKGEIARRVDEAAAMLEIAQLLERYPRQLSGGQRQRVAMGRAVVRRPRLFLFDEPLSNLDASLRGQMRVELKRLHARLGATMIYVTHDQVEAMTLADRIALLRGGAVIQVGSPDELYARPRTLFAARFFGTPEMNAIEGQVTSGSGAVANGAARFRAPGFDVPLDGAAPAADKATLGVRAEDISFSAPGEGHAVGRVEVLENLGWDTLVHLRAGDKSASAGSRITGSGSIVGSGTDLAVDLVARIESVRAPKPGETVGLRFAASRLHLFDGAGDRIANIQDHGSGIVDLGSMKLQ